MHHKAWHTHRNSSDLEIAQSLSEDGVREFLQCYRASLKKTMQHRRARGEKARNRLKSIMFHKENLQRN